MARLGEAPAAAQYDGIAVGPRMAYLFETQEGIPVDGTNALLRDLAPFVLRLLPPDALLEAAVANAAADTSGAGASSASSSLSILDQAALAADTNDYANTVASTLAQVSAIGNLSETTITSLEAFVANGEFVQSQPNSSFTSTLADAFTAADIALQLSRILKAPPLTLLVNPTEMTTTYTKMQNYQSRTRYGLKFEAWGEEQPTISFSGTTAGFVAGAVDVSNPFGGQVTGEASSVTGYQEAARRDSAAWQNFMNLYQFYRSNGYIYDTLGHSEAHLFIGSVAIDYDQWTYVGHIESFSFSFVEESPHKVTFQMEFRVTRMYDRAMASAVVVPQTAPTISPSTVGAAVNGQSTGTSLTGRQAVSVTGEERLVEIAQTPLDILGGF